MSSRSAVSRATRHSRNQSSLKYGVIRPGRGCTNTWRTFCPAKSSIVETICSSVSMSFQTQSGAVAYSRGGSANWARTVAESAAGAARAEKQKAANPPIESNRGDIGRFMGSSLARGHT